MLKTIQIELLEAEIDEKPNIVRRAMRDGFSREEFYSAGQAFQELVCLEHVGERKMVASAGHCSGNCTADNLVENYREETVCRWTWQPCPRQRMAKQLELFSLINNRRNP